MRPDSITLAIFEKYPPEELAATAAKLVQALADKETAETEKKMSDSAFKERINKHEAEAAECAKIYGKGGETAQIGCTIRYDMPTVGKKSYVRMDTEETVEVHNMSLEERQETLQFPLTAEPEKKPGEAEPSPAPKNPRKPKTPPPQHQPEPAEEPVSVQTKELTFKDIVAIAANIAKLPDDHRAAAIVDMQGRIAITLRVQKGCIGPDGVVETIDTQTKADAFAEAWLKLAVEKELAPPPSEDVTRLCPYPGCIDFAHEETQPHRFPKVDPERKADTTATPEPQREPEPKSRKRKPHAPPIEPPCQEPPPPAGGN